MILRVTVTYVNVLDNGMKEEWKKMGENGREEYKKNEKYYTPH